MKCNVKGINKNEKTAHYLLICDFLAYLCEDDFLGKYFLWNVFQREFPSIHLLTTCFIFAISMFPLECHKSRIESNAQGERFREPRGTQNFTFNIGTQSIPKHIYTCLVVLLLGIRSQISLYQVSSRDEREDFRKGVFGVDCDRDLNLLSNLK